MSAISPSNSSIINSGRYPSGARPFAIRCSASSIRQSRPATYCSAKGFYFPGSFLFPTQQGRSSLRRPRPGLYLRALNSSAVLPGGNGDRCKDRPPDGNCNCASAASAKPEEKAPAPTLTSTPSTIPQPSPERNGDRCNDSQGGSCVSAASAKPGRRPWRGLYLHTLNGSSALPGEKWR